MVDFSSITDRDVRETARWAVEHGFEVRPCKRGLRFSGHGRLVFSGTTPSDYRATMNLRAQLRRAIEGRPS